MLYIIIILCIIILDRISKWIVLSNMEPYETIPLIKDVFHLTYAKNTGAAFSIFKGNATLLAGFSVIVIGVMIYFLIRQLKRQPDKKWFIISISMIVGGAIGNLIDRLYYGFVIDFFDFRLINFAVFNVADSFVTVGGILLCAFLLFDRSIEI